MGQESRPRKAITILDLDDATLSSVFRLLDPLPDLFNAARTCTRFRDLLHTRCSWLVVGHEPSPAPAPPAPPLRCRQRFASLAEAVAASRRGDTILLEPTPPGRPHDAAGVAIAHPLRLLGGGAAPGDCIVRGPARGLPALAFAASARLSNLTVQGDGLAGAVAHRAGRLQIEDCELRCAARGLPHLAAPLVCMAAAAGSGGGGGGAAEAVRVGAPPAAAGPCMASAGCAAGLNRLASEPATPPATPTGCGSGPGAVAVAGCVLEGGSSAVRLCGGAALREVRVVYEAHKALFWFEVDAAPGEGGPVEGRGGGAAPAEAAPAPAAGPSWLGHGSGQGFDPRALQDQVVALMGGPAGPGAPPPPKDVEKKARAWRAGRL